MGHWRKEMISILVTNKCNMACKYCYLGDTTVKDEKEKRVIKTPKRSKTFALLICNPHKRKTIGNDAAKARLVIMLIVKT